MLRRPQPGEDEEDILKMQEEFLREKNKKTQPAAQVVNLRAQPSATLKKSRASGCGSKRVMFEEPSRKLSKYAQAKGLTNLTKKRQRIEDASGSLMGDIIEKNVSESNLQPIMENNSVIDQDDQVYFPTVIPLVMGNIVEKNPSQFDDSLEQVVQVTPKGFPLVRKRKLNIVSGAKSIFFQQLELENFDKSKDESKLMEVDERIPLLAPSLETAYTPLTMLPAQSFIVTSEDADSIHKQNIKILSKMSQNEILQEQQKLLAGLDHNLISFIKSRRATSGPIVMDTSEASEPANSSSKPTQQTVKDSSSDGDITQDVDDTLWDNDVLSAPKINKFLNFNTLERDKLEWMKGIEESKKLKSNEPYEARFSFKGYLLPYSTEYNEKTKTLFHHGEEPHRPGYTLMELFALSRSSVIQQRVTALNVIAGILEYYGLGIYKDVIDIPVTKIFFVIRMAIDENIVSVLEPALRAMRNLIYDRVDESCLDALLGLEEGCVQPSLEHDKSEIFELDSKESELKDFHLADIDLITGAVRVDIIQRLQYILGVVKPSFNCVQYSLQILTRIARDSVDLASNVIESDLLMKCIVENFIPVTGVNFRFDASSVYNGKPVLAAVKLIRVLALQSPEIAEVLHSKYKITNSVCFYISSGVEGTYGLRIQIEALSTLNNLVSNRVAVDQVMSLYPVLATSLLKHVRGTNLNMSESVSYCTHAAVLIQLVNRLLQVQNHQGLDELKTKFYPLAKQGFVKWINQLCTLNSYSCGHLRLVCASLDCMRVLIINESVESALTGEHGLMELLAHSNGFRLLLRHLLSSSNLLSSIDSKQLHTTKNLTNLGSTVIDRKHKVLPLLNLASPIPVLSSLVKLLYYFKDLKITTTFIQQILFYISALQTSLPRLCDNWFTRMEIDFLFWTLRITSKNIGLNETEKDLIYAVANKFCYVLRSDKVEELDYIFKNIVFNKQWFTVERLMNLVSLTDTTLFTKIFSSIDEIRLCYSKLINVNNKGMEQNIVLRKWQEPILPRDWIYLPIVKLYSDHKDCEDTPNVLGLHARKLEASKTADKEFIVTCCLEWILFNELSCMKLVTEIDVTDRFCRLMCVFLCDNSLFLVSKIKALLKKCIILVFASEKKCQFNFDKELTGINNFQDFYTQFLEQFQAVSYGDSTFAACVLAPLAQKHNIKWRKLVWSEYAACVRSLDCPEENLCYEINDYLYPEETDVSLIKSYVHALSSNLLRPNTIAYKIAEHHAICFKKSKSCSVNN